MYTTAQKNSIFKEVIIRTDSVSAGFVTIRGETCCQGLRCSEAGNRWLRRGKSFLSKDEMPYMDMSESPEEEFDDTSPEERDVQSQNNRIM